MKIYSNPNFPRAQPKPKDRQDRIDTLAFVSALQERNAKALAQLQAQGLRRTEDRRAKPPVSAQQRAPNHHTHQITGRTLKNGMHNHRFSGLTGPPIEVPGGHVHAISGTTELGQKVNE